MNDYYPPGVSELPYEFDEEREFIFEVGGEVTVLAYSEEQAEELLKQNMKDHLYDAYANGDIEII